MVMFLCDIFNGDVSTEAIMEHDIRHDHYRWFKWQKCGKNTKL